MRELAILRSCILRLWRTVDPQVSVDDAELLARVIDRAIERSVARYFDRRTQLLEGLEQIADAAFSAEDVATFLDRVLRIFIKHAPSIDSAAVLLREGDTVRVRAAVGLEEEARQGVAWKIGEGFAGTIAATREPLVLRRAWQDPLVGSDGIRARKTCALYGVPLVDRFDDDNVVGVAHIGSRDVEEIPEPEKRLFAALAQRATSAIIKHRLREAARRMAAQVDAVLEAIPNPAFMGTDERLTVANAAGLAMLGVSSREELRAPPETRRAARLRNPSTGEPMPDDTMPYARALRGETVTRDVLLYDHRAKADRIFREHAGPIKDGERIAGAVAVLSDLTELTHAMHQVRTLVDNMPELCWMALPDGHIDFYNRRWYEYTGTTFEEMQGWGWEKVHDPEVLPDVVRRWRHSLATGEAFEMEFPLRGADGVYRWFLTRVWPLRDANGRIVRWFGNNTNVDEQRRLRRELQYAMDDLERTAEFRERFIGIVSHDIRTPMSAIAASVGLLLKSPALAPELAKPAGRILANVERMTRMVSDLLDFTRGRIGGGIPIAPTPVDLAKVAKRVLDEFEQTYPARRIVCEKRGDTTGTWDGERLAQVMTNLVGNAIHHGASDQPIRVTMDGSGDEMVLAVHNTGPPIPPEVLPHVFDPFRRARTSQDASPGGLGLGLFIAREITRAHHGHLSVTSDAEHGVTFTLRLPRSPRPPSQG